jgi:hypothetical protein
LCERHARFDFVFHGFSVGFYGVSFFVFSFTIQIGWSGDFLPPEMIFSAAAHRRQKIDKSIAVLPLENLSEKCSNAALFHARGTHAREPMKGYESHPN